MSSEEEGEAPGTPKRADQMQTLTDPRAMRALAHPVRMALIELLGVADPITATQASEALGESPANCAFHLRTLAKYGLIKEAGGGRGRERPWTRTHRTLRLSTTEQTDAHASLAAGALARAWFDHWVERARQVIGSPPPPGWEGASDFSRASIYMTPEEATQVADEIQAILDRYRGRKQDPSLRPPGSLPAEMVFYVAPIVEWAAATESKTQDIS